MQQTEQTCFALLLAMRLRCMLKYEFTLYKIDEQWTHTCLKEKCFALVSAVVIDLVEN